MKKIDEARKLCGSLLNDLENSKSLIDPILMKAKRLARLMRDSDAQIWLNLETNGYPDKFYTSDLGSCLKYAESSHRINTETSKYSLRSLPEIEAIIEYEETQLASLRTSKATTSKVSDFLEKKATEALMTTQEEMHMNNKNRYATIKAHFSSLKSALHNYVTDTYLAVELGDVAEDIFDGARNLVDTFVRKHCPQAAEKLLAINERMADGTDESRSAALTSCRRLLMDIADSVFPAQKDEWQDRQGKKRKVGTDQYINRLLAYLADLVKSSGTYTLLETELSHLASRLDIIYEKTCKGVHTDVTHEEARLSVIHTYLFIGEIAKFSLQSEDNGKQGNK